MMRRRLRRRDRRHLREKRLHLIREARRLSRLHIKYNPNKPLQINHQFNINTKYRAADPVRGKRVLSFPRSLDFDGNVGATVDFLESLRTEFLHGESSEIFLDQQSLEELSPEASLVLLAELHRCLAYISRKKRVRGNYPNSPNATKMLTDVGFYTALNIKAPSREKHEGSRTYSKAICNNKTDGRIINQLISTFEKVVSFDPLAKKRLYSALAECMDNVRAHAYKDDPEKPDLFGEWWMAGFCDHETRQVAFVFYDQGLGIPATLKTKIFHKLKAMFNWDDSDLISYAVEEGLTKEQSKRHGSGLPSLKGFINELSPGGFLRVLANRGDYTYFKNASPRLGKLERTLNGSLIIWSILPDNESRDQSQHANVAEKIDLTSRQERLPL